MIETMQEVCRSIDWIIHNAKHGFFLIVANESQQKELRSKYESAPVFVYDWEGKTEAFQLSHIPDLITRKIGERTIFFFDFQNAIRDVYGARNLNFLRDAIFRTETNIIFVVTPEGYDRLNTEAMDVIHFMNLSFFLCELD